MRSDEVQIVSDFIKTMKSWCNLQQFCEPNYNKFGLKFSLPIDMISNRFTFSVNWNVNVYLQINFWFRWNCISNFKINLNFQLHPILNVLRILGRQFFLENILKFVDHFIFCYFRKQGVYYATS